MKREEQIKQNAEDYINENTQGVVIDTNIRNFLLDVYLAGAHSRDEEIQILKERLQHRQDLINVLTDELEKARNPWMDVKKELPKDEQLCIVWIEDAVYGLFCKVCRYFASIGFVIDRGEVTHWMQIPPLSPDEQLISGLKQMQQDLEKGGAK